MDIAIGLIGHSGSGKSTLARALTLRVLGAHIVSFGDAVRERAAAAGDDPNSRAVLMRMGQRWVDTDVEGYCRAVLDQSRDDARVLIIEGIRHELVREKLKELLAPVDLTCVLLKAPYQDLVDRMHSEYSLSPDDAQQVLNDPTETQVDQLLLGAADLIVNAAAPLQDNVQEVVEWIEDRLRRASGRVDEDLVPQIEIDVLTPADQADLVNVVSAEFDMLLLEEAAGKLFVAKEQLKELRRSGQFIALRFKGQLLVPGFELEDGRLNPRISEAVSALAEELSDWEIVSWLISNNGLLDGKRPIDVPAEDLRRAVTMELEA